MENSDKLNYQEKITLADYIARFIADKETPAVFQLSGGMIAFIIDAIGRLGKTQIINTRHEQAAGFAAEGSARISGLPGFAFGTSGPGATNLITPIASSYFDSTPVVFITGQVNQKDSKRNPNQRQNGFQELNICEMAKYVTKKVYSPQSSREALIALNEGWLLCQEARKGPVLIDIPINLQQELVQYSSVTPTISLKTHELSLEARSKFEDMLKSASKPLLLIGAGVRMSNATDLLREFMKKTGIPCVSTLMGLDSTSRMDEKYLGFIGVYGNRWANAAVEQSDLLIVLGSRLDVRQTGQDVPKFRSGKKIIRVDVDDHELDGRVRADLIFNTDISVFLRAVMDTPFKIDSSPFVTRILNIQTSHPQESEQKLELALNPNRVVEFLCEVFSDALGFVVDVGQHQMWAAQSIDLKEGQRFLTSGGLGAMGFAIPASIGASATKSGRWVSISGDGCLQLSSAELQTIIQYKLPIAVCVFNNGQHGMVAQFQEENMDCRFIGTREGFSNPNFQELARVYGFETVIKVEDYAELESLPELLKNVKAEPIFLEFVIDPQAQALPKMSREDE